MQDQTDVDIHKGFASGANNVAWDLIETQDLTPGQTAELVELAATARFHWSKVGAASALAHADLLLGWALARAGASAAALHSATQAFSYFEANDAAPWELAFAHAALAQAHWSGGDKAAHADHWTRANTLGDALDEADAKYFRAAFATVPKPD